MARRRAHPIELGADRDGLSVFCEPTVLEACKRHFYHAAEAVGVPANTDKLSFRGFLATCGAKALRLEAMPECKGKRLATNALRYAAAAYAERGLRARRRRRPSRKKVPGEPAPLQVWAVPTEQGYYEPDVSELVRAKAYQQFGFGTYPTAARRGAGTVYTTPPARVGGPPIASSQVVFDKVDVIGNTAHPLFRYLAKFPNPNGRGPRPRRASRIARCVPRAEGNPCSIRIFWRASQNQNQSLLGMYRSTPDTTTVFYTS